MLTSDQKKANTPRGQDSLFHWESLLVTSSHDFEDIAFEFLSYIGMNKLMDKQMKHRKDQII